MTQPQLSVREKAREMFAVKYLLNDEISNIIDQIITLAQEEKEKEISSIIQEEFYRVSVEDSSMRTKEWTAYRDMVVKLNKILKQ